MFKRFLHLPTAMAVIAITLAFTTMPATAYQISTQYSQSAEARDASGRLWNEASRMYLLTCNGAGENGRQYYLYQYLKRLGFRVILPPNYGQAIGGRDFSSYEEAANTACHVSR